MGEEEGDRVGLWRFSLLRRRYRHNSVSLFCGCEERREKWGGKGGEKGLNRVGGGGGGNNGNKPAVIEDIEREKTVCRPLGGGKEKVGDKCKSHSFFFGGGEGAQFLGFSWAEEN